MDKIQKIVNDNFRIYAELLNENSTMGEQLLIAIEREMREIAGSPVGIKLPMTITLKKYELDSGYYDGIRNHRGKTDFLYNYCKKKKIPLDEPKNKEGKYDRFVITLGTPEQALNLLLWDKFDLLRNFSA